MKLALAVLVVAAGCNEIYGLDETTVRDPFENDSDFDSVLDATDNCPDVANANQADLDADGLGDKCDFCPFCEPCANPANHDEDGDLDDDACDNCPAYDNPGQENRDGDDLGNACDPNDDVMHHRRFFDGFRTLSPDWLQNGAPWGIDQDGVVPMPGFDNNTYLLRHRMLQITSGEAWLVDIGTDTNDAYVAGMVLNSNGSALVCHVIHSGPEEVTYLISNNGVADTMRLDATEISRLRLTVSGTVGAQKTQCDVVGVRGITSNNMVIVYPLTFDLRAIGSPRFRYIDVIGP